MMTGQAHAASPVQLTDKTGFLVVAPDRGFLGNAEIQDAFEAYQGGFNTALSVATSEQTDRFLQEGIKRLEDRGAKQIVVLPVFFSDKHPLYQLAIKRLTAGKLAHVPWRVAPTLAGHYLVGEILNDRLAAVSRDPAKEAVFLISSGAKTKEQVQAYEQAMLTVGHAVQSQHPVGKMAAVALGAYGASDVAAGSMRRLDTLVQEAKTAGCKPIFVPCDLGTKYDSMMSFDAQVAGLGKKYQGAVTPGLLLHANLTLWLRQQSNRELPVTPDSLGIVLMPHGASHPWNQRLLDSVAPLRKRYKIEPAFSMADPVVVERAIRRLERQGVRHIVVVRIFSLASSFKAETEYMLGLSQAMGHGGHDHGMPMVMTRIRTGAALTTVGGVEDSPWFAEALLDRAVALSKDPAKETVVLVAHGIDDEAQNRHWLGNLDRLATLIRQGARQRGLHFRNVQSLTWREDWDSLRAQAITAARQLVETAKQNDGQVLVVPARTNGAGQEAEWLAGQGCRFHPDGFAPHPAFTRWVEQQITTGMAQFSPAAPVAPASQPAAHDHHHHH
jgi:sirohydrochlorin ferrochelatase